MQLVYDGWPDAFYIRGHVTDDEALSILEESEENERLDMAYVEKDWVKTLYKARTASPLRQYARWSIEPGPDGSYQTLRDYKVKGRGRFPVTVIQVIKWEKENNFYVCPENNADTMNLSKDGFAT